ncbi:MAG TPA: flippase activity-associated protein Agl23 [Ktedonobacterales bacterium]|nr:flippase activity-associated protein Agl23 [Ktedonobacterales bacterium]
MSGRKRNGNGKPLKRKPQGAPAARASAPRNVTLASASSGSSARDTTTRANDAPERRDALTSAVEPTERAVANPNTAAVAELASPLAPLPELENVSADDNHNGARNGSPAHNGRDGQHPYSEPTASVQPIEQIVALEEPPVVEKTSLRPSFERPRLDFNWNDLGVRGKELPGAIWAKLRNYSPEQYCWFGVLLLAAILRFWDLGGKPLHHDESMHAYFSLSFANDPASYAYNPLLHGPFQFHAEGIVFAILIGLEHLFHQAQPWGNPWITDATARIVPATFGLGIVALPIWLRRELGRPGALIAAFLLAVSPAFVYFSRFLREDIYFNFFMFLMIVAAVRFASARSLRWFVTLFAATVLAYATFEGTYLALVIFFSFLALLLIWELAQSLARVLPRTLTPGERIFFSRATLLVLAGGAGALAAHYGIQTLNTLNDTITKSTAAKAASDAFVQQLEDQTVAVILYASIIIALVVIGALFWQMYRDDAAYTAEMARALAPDPDDLFDDDGFALEDERASPPLSRVERLDRILTAPGRAKANLRERLDPQEQPFMRLVLGISWVQWFVAFVAGWMLFAALFWVLPGDGHTLGQGFQQGIGQGVWQGIYYWIQQQKVARGGQPWYYYLMLIPLYEQLACVFGLSGIVYSLFRPTRFRVFLIWWFALSLFLYSWAGEKMPWLSIHILLPLMLLAGIALAAVLRGCVALVRQLAGNTAPAASLTHWLTKREATRVLLASGACFLLFLVAELATIQSLPLLFRLFVVLPLLALSLALFVMGLVIAGIFRPTATILGATLAILLLIPMIHSMLVLSYQDPANGPHEMMVYVQTTPDVDLVMRKIQQADQALYGGRHLLKIGVGAGQEWPFYWYLRDYHNVAWGYNASSPSAQQEDVLILSTAADGVGSPDTSDAFMALHPHDYTAKEYALRSWWDEGYKPPPCVATKRAPCPASANWGSGVGPGLYLTYGSNPPPGAQFDFGRAAGRVWSWLWTRQAFGNTTGPYYDFVFVVRNGVPVQP